MKFPLTVLSPFRVLRVVGLMSMVLALSGLLVRPAQACPFCTSVAQTFTEEMNSMQVVVMGKLVEAPPVPESGAIDPTAPLPKAKFEVTVVIKGAEWVPQGTVVEMLYFGEPNKDRTYLLMGTDFPNGNWSTPLGLSSRAVDYITHLPKLPADGARLEFFQEHLEDEDEMLTRDAYDEFAKAPYKDVIALGPKMHRDKLLTWVQDENVPASRKRLYYTMLGVCGKPEDALLLEKLMRSEDRKVKAGLDALIACLLLLQGPDGLNQVEDLFLKKADAEYADTYAAIMAIRFHGTEVSVIPRERLVQSLRHLLERAELADLVIPDLAKWEDWAVMPRLVQLFKEADEKSSWVRVPVINYLRMCPLPEAKQAIEELAQIDPEAVKRAQTFFPVDSKPSTSGSAGEANTVAPGAPAADDASAPKQPQPESSSALAPPMPAHVSVATEDGDFAAALSTPEEKGDANGSAVAAVSSATKLRTLAKASTKRTSSAPSMGQRWMNQRWIWSVPVLASVLLWGTFRTLLGVRPWTFRV